MKRIFQTATLFLALTSLLPAVGGAQEVLFAAKTEYATGGYPTAVAVGDFDGDGRPDIVTANYNGNSVSVLRNNGNGTFAAKTDYYANDSPTSVAVGDVNGDGRPDIVTANFDTDTVSVLLGNGNGTFAAETDYATNGLHYSVAVGDFDGDGKTDIVTATAYDNSMSILRNNGNGTFAAKVDYTTGANPRSIAVGDFDGDGKLDIVTANVGIDTVSVLLNIVQRSRVSGLLILEGIVASAPTQVVQFTFRSPGYDDFAPTLNVSPSGNFAMNLPKRSGTLHIKAAAYLAANVDVYTTSGDISGLMAILLAGDGSNDNKVDIADFGLLVNAYDSDITLPGSGYNPNADFNGDGVVDIADFGLLVNNYGRQGAN